MTFVEYKSAEAIQNYKNTQSDFVDYVRFEGDASFRKAQKAAFIADEQYTPDYDYKKLNFLADDDVLTAKKTAIYEAVLELDAAKEAPGADVAELELYRQFHELRLKRIMLVEAARNLHSTGTSSEMEIAREAFMQMNEETYGEIDTPVFKGMLSTEIDRLDSFAPTNDLAKNIKSELAGLLSHSETDGEVEKDLLSPEELEKIREVIFERYSDILAAIPETDDSVYYDVTECVDIMNHALEVAGLASEGWLVMENPAKSNPSTLTEEKKINLPSNTRRNASELRRLTLHEVEVHARRGQNGVDSGRNILTFGTADYADVEEGLGVMLECAIEGSFDSTPFHRARDRYLTAGLALGVDSGRPRDAHQTFNVLWRTMAVRNAKDGEITEEAITKAKNQAYVHVENAFRGTPFWRQGVIYTKLKVYYEGLQKNAEFFRDNIDNLDGALDKASIGKYNHTDPEEYDLIVSSVNASAEI